VWHACPVLRRKYNATLSFFMTQSCTVEKCGIKVNELDLPKV
jgi:hypothetical protein